MMADRSKTYFVKTFGCAANVADSERIAALYQKKGYKPAKNLDEAQVVIINTCSVRQSAENRVYGLINNLVTRMKNLQHRRHRGKQRAQRIVLAGCMLRYGVSDLKKKLPGVDEFLRMEEVGFNLPAVRENHTHAWVPIMEGCNQFCSYCVVPYARGREKSRPFEEIVCEVEKLVKQGYKEIILLGQNVNAYKPSFAKLLGRLHEVPGLEKISFLTSNPWDLTEEIIQSIKLPKIEKYLHLPVQSGDDKILKKMNRPYTVKQYLSLIAKIRKEIPEIKIGTDIIVGFPEETKKQFENTVKLCKKVGFVKAYIAKYSPRPGTTAYKLKDDISPKEKKRRWRILEELINKKS